MIAVELYRKPRILLLTIFVIIATGLSSYVVLPQLEDPVLSRRVGVISTLFPGATPGSVESLITIPIEEELDAISGVKQIRSNTLAEISNIVVELSDDVTDVETIWSEVREKIAELEPLLPENSLPPEIDVIPLKAFAAIVAIEKSTPDDSQTGDGTVDAQLGKIAAGFRRELLSLPGTEQVDLFGETNEELAVVISPETLVRLQTSVGAIAQQISAKVLRRPMGQIEESPRVLRVESALIDHPEAHLRNLQIRSGPHREVIQLSQFARIERQPKAAAYEVVIDGEPAIVIAAMVNDEYRVDQWFKDFSQRLETYRNDYGPDVSFDLLFSQSEHIDARMLTLLKSLGFGTLAVTAVVLVLMGWRSTLIIGIALPLTALFVLAGLRGLSVPIQQMSVTGLIVALGLLIDNAIVIVDELQAEIRSGNSPVDAIRNTIQLFGIPLLGSTLTTALAFLPIATLPGPPGEFVGSIATTVILAISGSLLLSLTVIPAAFCILSKKGLTATTFGGLKIGWLSRLYLCSLRIVFRFPILGILCGLILPCLGFYFASQLPEQFFPPSDRQQIQVELERPMNESLEGTRQGVEAARRIIAQNKNVERQHWFLGGSAPTFYYNVIPRRRGTAFYAQAFVELIDGAHSREIVNDLQAALDSGVPDSRMIVRQLEQGPPIDSPIEIRLSGPDAATLTALGHQMRQILTESPYVIHTRADFEESIPKVVLAVDEPAAMQAGLDSSQLSGQIYTTLHGAAAGAILQQRTEIPIVVRVDFQQANQFEQLLALPLPSASSPVGPPHRPTSTAEPGWNVVSLGSLTSRSLESDVGAIVRIDGERVNEVRAHIHAGVLPATALADFRQRLSDSGLELPAGYEMNFGGEEEQRSHAVTKLISNGIVLFSVMLLTLVAAFQSFRCAGIIATVGSLSIGLGPLALYLAGYPFGFTAIIGTMGLVGVAINDSIVVLAAIRANPLAQAGNHEEIVNVVSHCTRHIVATTLTTIVGFLPLILGGGGFWPPLALCIAGGVGGATMMALYFVPSLFLMVFPRRVQANS